MTEPSPLADETPSDPPEEPNGAATGADQSLTARAEAAPPPAAPRREPRFLVFAMLLLVLSIAFALATMMFAVMSG